MNERDSEQVAAQFVARGYSLAESEAGADVILLNTCSVRDRAERKAVGKMRTLASQVRKSRRPVVLGFLGCMAQSRGGQLLTQVPAVDLVVGTEKFHRTPDLVADLISGRRKQVVEVGAEGQMPLELGEHLSPAIPGRGVAAFVSIMQGCNQFCTFCIVPYTRGQERSRPIAQIVEECRQLSTRGIKEVTLLGQIVTSYGRREIPSLQGRSPLVQLLEAIEQVEGLDRIRFTAPHPRGYGDDLVEAYGRLPKLVESAHLPVQSGSDEVLKLMHRGHTREQFLKLTGKLRQTVPHIGITTDLIVGFPGETEADFEQTLSLVREVGFDSAFVFKYSPRQDTPAASMPGQVPVELIEERHARLLQQVNQTARVNYERLVGQRLEVLVEGPSKRIASRMMGRSRCNKIVVFDGTEQDRGRLLQLEMVRAGSFTLYGKRVSAP